MVSFGIQLKRVTKMYDEIRNSVGMLVFKNLIVW